MARAWLANWLGASWAGFQLALLGSQLLGLLGCLLGCFGWCVQPVGPSSLHDRFGDSAPSGEDSAMGEDLSFVKGSATHGDVHKFAYDMLRLIRGRRKASYRLPDQL